MSTPYPIVFAPQFFEKVWGGRRLERLGKSLPADKPIGESWELADLGATSASGAGGGAARSSITNGELTGHTLHDAVHAWGVGLSGVAKLTPAGDFPMLVKFLDAREDLSIQVHPSPAYAAAHRSAHLKTESWYILDAEPGAVIYKGVKPGVTRESFAKHIEDGSVVNDLIAEPATIGDCHNLPSGTVHALGAGVLVAEVQTPSDTTFRVFDWGRKGRELHVAQALDCIDFGPAPAAARYDAVAAAANSAGGFSRLVTTEFFAIDEARPSPGAHLSVSMTGACAVLIVLSGSCELRSAGKGFRAIPLLPGTTCLVPAAIVGRTLIDAGDGRHGDLKILRATLA